MVAGTGIEFLILMIFLGLGNSAGPPMGLPPAPEDPFMAAVAPEECIVYSMWTGIAEPLESGTPTEKWLAQPEIRNAWNQLQDAWVEQCIRENDPAKEPEIRAAAAVAKHAFTHAGCFYLTALDVTEHGVPRNISGGVVLDLGDQAESLYPAISSLVAGMCLDEDEEIGPVTIGDIEFVRYSSPDDPDTVVTWGMVGRSHFAVAVGVGEMERLLERAATPRPEWLGQLRDRLPVPRVSSVSWIDGKRALAVLDAYADELGDETGKQVIDRLGLREIASIGMVTGLDDQGFVARAHIAVVGEPRGLLGIFGEQPLVPETFSRVPGDRMTIQGAAVSPRKLMKLIEELGDIGEFTRGEFRKGVDELNRQAEIDFETDFIGQLDDSATVYGSINMTNPSSGWVMTVGASNEMALTDPIERLTRLIEKKLAESQVGELRSAEVNGSQVWSIHTNRDGWIMMPEFSWALANREVVIGMDSSSVRRHLRREGGEADAIVNDEWFMQMFTPPSPGASGPLVISSTDISQLFELGVPLAGSWFEFFVPEEFGFRPGDIPPLDVLTLNMKPSMGAVYRTPDGFEVVQRQTYPGGSPVNLAAAATFAALPHAVDARVASVRARNRMTTANNLKQLVLAMHNYHESFSALPARYSKDADDRPLLSWRVHILPFIGESELYEQFHLDEPWDSEHNKGLIELMPDVFAHPQLDLEPGKTVFLTPQGTDSILTDPTETIEDTQYPTGLDLAEIHDGTSRTAILVEVSDKNAVFWTQPQDYRWEDEMSPEAGLNDVWEKGAYVACADGAVHLITFEKLAEVFELLAKTSDGGVVTWDE